jgi:hypothetical protein
MVTQLNKLKIDLKLDGSENEEKVIPMTPENMGDF